jgi:hypothetical protein
VSGLLLAKHIVEIWSVAQDFIGREIVFRFRRARNGKTNLSIISVLGEILRDLVGAASYWTLIAGGGSVALSPLHS